MTAPHKTKKSKQNAILSISPSDGFFITIEMFFYHWKNKYLLNWIIKHHLRFSHFKQHMRNLLIFVYEGIKSDWWKNKAESLPRRKVKNISNLSHFGISGMFASRAWPCMGKSRKKRYRLEKKIRSTFFLDFFYNLFIWVDFT